MGRTERKLLRAMNMEKEKRNAERARENRYQILEAISESDALERDIETTVVNRNLSNKELKKMYREKQNVADLEKKRELEAQLAEEKLVQQKLSQQLIEKCKKRIEMQKKQKNEEDFEFVDENGDVVVQKETLTPSSSVTEKEEEGFLYYCAKTVKNLIFGNSSTSQTTKTQDDFVEPCVHCGELSHNSDLCKTYKTKMCWYQPSCRLSSEQCIFAHSIDELRKPEQEEDTEIVIL